MMHYITLHYTTSHYTTLYMLYYITLGLEGIVCVGGIAPPGRNWRHTHALVAVPVVVVASGRRPGRRRFGRRSQALLAVGGGHVISVGVGVLSIGLGLVILHYNILKYNVLYYSLSYYIIL